MKVKDFIKQIENYPEYKIKFTYEVERIFSNETITDLMIKDKPSILIVKNKEVWVDVNS